MRKILILAALGLSGASAAGAEDILPTHAQTLDLGGVTGVAYYTVQEGRHQVVVTLSEGAATPVRVVAPIAPGETLTFSVPGGLGSAGQHMTFTRTGDRISVSSQGAATSN